MTSDCTSKCKIYLLLKYHFIGMCDSIKNSFPITSLCVYLLFLQRKNEINKDLETMI